MKQVVIKKEVRYPFRSLQNYQAIHKTKAEQTGRIKEFMQAKTLTQARKVLFGG